MAHATDRVDQVVELHASPVDLAVRDARCHQFSSDRVPKPLSVVHRQLLAAVKLAEHGREIGSAVGDDLRQEISLVGAQTVHAAQNARSGASRRVPIGSYGVWA